MGAVVPLFGRESRPQPQGYRRRFQSFRLTEVGPEKLVSIFAEADKGDLRNAYRLFRRLGEDAHIQADYGTRRAAVSAARWELEAGADDAFSVAFASFCRAQLRSLGTRPAQSQYADDELDFAGLAHHLLDAVGQGISFAELGWAREGRLVVLRNAWRLTQDRLWWEDGQPPRLADDGVQPYELGGRDLTPGKYVVHTPLAENGERTASGCFRSVSKLWVFKNWGWKFWMQGAENFAWPFLLGYATEHIRGEVQEELLEALEKLRAGYATTTSDKNRIELLESNVKDGMVWSRLTEACDRGISKAILGHTDSTEPAKVGAWKAVESRKTTTVDPRIALDEQGLVRTVRRDILQPLLDFNEAAFPGARLPALRWVVGDRKAVDPSLVGKRVYTRDQILVATGHEPIGGELGAEFV